MNQIPIQRFAGSVLAFGSYGAPTIAGVRIGKRHVVLALLVALAAALWVTGAIHIGHVGGVIAAGGFLSSAEREARTTQLRLATEARSILENGPKNTALPADDQVRYDKLMDEYDALGETVKRYQRSSAADTHLASPIAPPTKPDVRSDDRPGAKKIRRAVASPEYRAAYRRYLTTGQVPQNLAAIAEEHRALQMDSDTVGGFLVASQQASDSIIKFVDDNVFVRQLATKFRVPNAQSLGVPQLTTDVADADWTSELATGSEDSSMVFGKREFRPFPLAKLIKISNKLIRAAQALTEFADDDDGQESLTPEGLVNDRLGYKFAIAEEKAYMSGTGNQQPLGLFTASADGIPTTSDFTCASSTAIAAVDLIDAKYTLKEQYQRSKTTRWLFNKVAIRRVRKLTDTNGQFVWAPGGIGQASLTADKQDTILEVPFVMSEYVPSTFTTGLYVGLIGDIRFYWIADALDLTIQRLVELYAATNQVGFIGRKETDGMPVLGEAFVRLKLA